jgi:hypothetical protein
MNLLIKEHDKTLIHATNAQGYDVTLCSFDINGAWVNEGETWEEAVETNKKITCPTCIAIIEHCKKYKKGKDY